MSIIGLTPPPAECAAPEPRRLVVVGVVAAAGVLVALQMTALVISDTPPWRLALDVTVAVVGLATVSGMVRRPVAAAVALNLLAALSPAATPMATMATFHVARWRPFTQAWRVAVVGVLAHLVLGVWRPAAGISYGWYAVLDVIAYATLVGWGAYSQARRELMRSLTARALRAEADQAAKVAEARQLERDRIAREMHDVLAHRLSLLSTYAGALEYRPDSSPERLAGAAGVIRAGLREASQELREVITLLRDDERADEAGSLRPLPTLLDLPRLVEECGAAGMRISLRSAPDVADDVPAPVSRAAYRVVQEGLTNARRHAPGAPVTVVVSRPAAASVVVEVRNPASPAPGSEPGHGLAGLSERVTLLGGELRHGLVDGEFELRAELGWNR